MNQLCRHCTTPELNNIRNHQFCMVFLPRVSFLCSFGARSTRRRIRVVSLTYWRIPFSVLNSTCNSSVGKYRTFRGHVRHVFEIKSNCLSLVWVNSASRNFFLNWHTVNDLSPRGLICQNDFGLFSKFDQLTASPVPSKGLSISLNSNITSGFLQSLFFRFSCFPVIWPVFQVMACFSFRIINCFFVLYVFNLLVEILLVLIWEKVREFLILICSCLIFDSLFCQINMNDEISESETVEGR